MTDDALDGTDRPPPGGLGNGRHLVVAFTRWLEGQGWTVHQDPSGAAVSADREGLGLHAALAVEATAQSVHEAYGRLLARMTPERDGAAFALVVADAATRHAVAVHPELRGRLGIEVHSVDEAGGVRLRR